MPSEAYTPPAGAVLHHTRAYLDSRPPAAPVHLVQYDDTLPVIAAALYAGDMPYAVPAGGSVSVRMGKPDGHSIYNPALGLDQGRQTAYIQVTPQMTALAGDLAPVLEITVGGGLAGTSALALTIDPNPVPEEKIQSADEYRTVQVLAAQAAQAAAAAASSAQTAHDRAEAADTAKGEAQTANSQAQGSAVEAAGSASDAQSSAGEAAGSAAQAAAQATAATQQAAAAAASAQAAREAAEQAQSVAQGALGYYADAEALQAAHPAGAAGQWAIVGNPDSIWVWDVEGGAWVDSGQHIDLSDYYTKTQTEGLIDAARGSVFLISVPAAGWQGPEGGPWTNSVAVEGMTAQAILSGIQLAPSQVGSDDAEQAYAQWSYLDTQAGTVQFTAEGDKPAADFTILARTTEAMQAAGDLIDLDALKGEILLAAHPVGSYYWSDEDTSPAVLFGGTWEAVENRFLLAAGEGHAAGSMGGEEEHTLTVEEMPTHSHEILTQAGGIDNISSGIIQRGLTGSSTNSMVNTRSVGNSEPHNNMPPYLCAYCWRRTA